jgi:hypothetical protein
MSLINVVMTGPAVGVVPSTVVATGAGVLVGNGAYVGSKVSVARATGEQATNPPKKLSVPTFSTSLREIFLVMEPPKANYESHIKRIRAFILFGFLYQPYIAARLEIA